MNQNNKHCIDTCNQLLRGERSAVETYGKAIEKHAGKPEISLLERIRAEHERSVAALERNVESMGGVPDQESGAWGQFTKAIQSTVNLLGIDSAVQSLLTGEGIGDDSYRDALNDENVMEECKSLIRSELRPRVEEHIRVLKAMQASDS